MKPEKIMVLGANGMLGSAVLRYFHSTTGHDVVGVVRSAQSVRDFPDDLREKLVVGGNVEDVDGLMRLFMHQSPTILVNCVGIVKQLDNATDPLAAIPINSVLPHRLARICSLVGARLIHMSTDCVFDGRRGMYSESDLPNASDLYGRTKLLGEVDYPNSITLRTSIIGRELSSQKSLVEWFLAQEGPVGGYSKAIFSGLPTVEIARVIERYVIPFPELSGVYHLSSEPIDKLSLLQLVAREYEKRIAINDDPSLVIDRSLDSSRFRDATGYKPDRWPVLVQSMRDFA